MLGASHGVMGPSQVTAARAHGSPVDMKRWLLGMLLAVLAVAAIVGVVMAFANGQPALGFIVALTAGAFFSRVGC